MPNRKALAKNLSAHGPVHENTDPGYHVFPIEKGVLGQISKIQEELDELKDAETQGIRLMQLQELSDIVGAISAYLEAKFPGIDIHDLLEMADVTKRAFKSGHRK